MSIYIHARKIYHKTKGIIGLREGTTVKRIYNNWYWKERDVKKSIYHSVNGRIPFVIRRYAENMGIGSYAISNIAQIDYALASGYLPVVDMLNYNGENKDGKNVNRWELYFQQPCEIKLEDVYSYGIYRLSSGGCPDNAPSDSMLFFSDKEKLQHWHSLFINYCKFNKDTMSYVTDEFQQLLCNKGKILGILCRGTDYLKLRPKGHPVQPEVFEVIQKAKAIMEKNQCNYLYLATEDYRIEQYFRHEFGDKVIINKRIYKNYQDGYLANTNNERKNDKYYTDLEYLSSLYLLSRCNCLISGRTSGAVIVMLMNYLYEYTYFWDLGVY